MLIKPRRASEEAKVGNQQQQPRAAAPSSEPDLYLCRMTLMTLDDRQHWNSIRQISFFVKIKSLKIGIFHSSHEVLEIFLTCDLCFNRGKHRNTKIFSSPQKLNTLSSSAFCLTINSTLITLFDQMYTHQLFQHALRKCATQKKNATTYFHGSPAQYKSRTTWHKAFCDSVPTGRYRDRRRTIPRRIRKKKKEE